MQRFSRNLAKWSRSHDLFGYCSIKIRSLLVVVDVKMLQCITKKQVFSNIIIHNTVTKSGPKRALVLFFGMFVK